MKEKEDTHKTIGSSFGVNIPKKFVDVVTGVEKVTTPAHLSIINRDEFKLVTLFMTGVDRIAEEVAKKEEGDRIENIEKAVAQLGQMMEQCLALVQTK